MLENASERHKGIIALLALAMMYGFTALITRYLSLSFDLLPQIYLRLGVGFLLSMFFFRMHLHTEKLATLPHREWGILVARAFLYYLLGVTLYNEAVLLTKVTNVVLVEMIPITAIFGFILLKEPFTFKKAGIIALSMLGVCIVALRDTSSLLTFGLGEVVALLSSAFIALAFISRRWHSPILNDHEIATYTLFFATLMILSTSLLHGDALPIRGWTLGSTLVVLLGGVLNVGISFLPNYGFARIDAVLASNILTVQVVFAALGAFLLFGETPLVHEILGGVFIIGAAIALNYLETPKKS